MRFEVSRVLDAIERRLSTDPGIARAVVDIGEVLRYSDLDGGRPASLLRLGLVIDALGRQVAEEEIKVYSVADRAVLSDGDLTSNERMVIRRWSDDGLAEVLPAAGDRVLEVADFTGLPVLTRRPPAAGYPWMSHDPGRVVVPVAGPGGVALRGTGGVAAPQPLTHPAMSRLWRCPEPGCASFGPERVAGQPPPRLRAGVPICPRHEHRLVNAGERPPAVTLAVRIGGVVKQRFAVAAGGSVAIGRDPSEPGAICLGPWLSGGALREVSRSHVVVSLTAAGLEVVDMSTNGTGVHTPSGTVALVRGEPRLLEPAEVVELHPGVEVALAGHWRSGGVSEPRSVMAEAPTMAIKFGGAPPR
jgi:hypothetical protein